MQFDQPNVAKASGFCTKEEIENIRKAISKIERFDGMDLTIVDTIENKITRHDKIKS